MTDTVPSTLVHESGLPGHPTAPTRGFACFNTARTHRWYLARDWAVDGFGWPTATMVAVCCNPSGAGAGRNDATVRRLTGYAIRERCTRLEVVNLSPRIATTPAGLPPGWDRVHRPHWLGVIQDAVTQGTQGLAWGPLRYRDGPAEPPLVLLAWGGIVESRQWLAARAQVVRRWLGQEGIRWHALGCTTAGHPVHPLRQRADAPLIVGPSW